MKFPEADVNTSLSLRDVYALSVVGEVAKVLLLACCEALAGSLRRASLRDAVSEGCGTCYRASFASDEALVVHADRDAKTVYGAPARGFTMGSIRR